MFKSWVKSLALLALVIFSLSACSTSKSDNAVNSSVPPAPDKLYAEALNQSAYLSWDDVSQAYGYIIFVRQEGSDFTPYATVFSNNAKVLGLKNGVTYEVGVASVNLSGYSKIDDTMFVTPKKSTAVPSGVPVVVATPMNQAAQLSWSHATGADYYEIYKSDDNSMIMSTIQTSVIVNNLTNATAYSFYVVAANDKGKGANSNSVSVTPLKPTVAPAAPEILSYAAASSSVSIAWSASGTAESYTIYISQDQTSYTPLATTTGLSYTALSLTPNTTYYFKVGAKNSAGEALSDNRMVATSSNETIPDAPSNVGLVAGNSVVNISWDGSLGAMGYNIYYSTSQSGGFIKLGTTSGTNFVAKSLTNAVTYYFYITALNSAGESNRGIVAAATPQVPLSPPLTPTGLMAYASNSAVYLTWDNSSDVDSYNIFIATTSGGTYYQIASTVANSYLISGIENGKTYYFKVKGVNVEGESQFSEYASATPTAPIVAPFPPYYVSAIAGDTVVNLSWKPSLSATSYKIYMGTSQGAQRQTAVAITSQTSYTVDGLQDGTTYYFKIAAGLNDNATPPNYLEGDNSTEVVATPVAAMLPRAPQGLMARAGDTTVSLSWNAVEEATKYIVYAAITPNSEMLPIMTVSDTNYTATRVQNGYTYWFAVASVNSKGTGEKSQVILATPRAPVVAPSAPTNLTSQVGDGFALLQWDSVAGATSYNIYYTMGEDDFNLLNSASVNAYPALNLKDGTRYKFYIKAHNSAGESAKSNTITSTPLAPIYPPAPPFSIAASAGDRHVDLSWSASYGATSYSIYCDNGTGAGTDNYSILTSTPNTYVAIDELQNGVKYSFYVVASNSAGIKINGKAEDNDTPSSGGAFGRSPIATATPKVPTVKPAAPTQLTALSFNQAVALQWSSSSNADNYSVYSSSDNVNFTKKQTTNGLSTYISGLTNGTPYYFKVSAINAGGESDKSDTAAVTPIAPSAKPSKPLGFVGTVSGGTSVNLSWNAANNANYYVVYMSSDNVSFLPQGLTMGTTYAVSNLTVNKNYYFYVAAANPATGESAPSITMPISTTTPLPSAPTSVTVTNINANNFSLTWTAVPYATKYYVWIGTESYGTFYLTATVTSMSQLPIQITQIKDGNIEKGTPYWVMVQSINGTLEGGTTAPLKVRTTGN